MDRRLSVVDCFSPQLDSLPDDVILLIFSYCNVSSLGRLSQVCRIFCHLLSEEYIWLSLSRRLTLINLNVTNTGYEPTNDNAGTSHDIQAQGECVERTRNITLKERCRIAKNWTEGRFRDEMLIRYHERQMPCMQRSGRHLWVSSYNVIKRYRYFSSGHVRQEVGHTLRGFAADVSRFRCRNDRIVCAYRDGGVCGWMRNGNTLWFRHPHFQTSVQCVDFRGNIIVTGSRDARLKVMRVGEPLDNSPTEQTMSAGDRVWSVALNYDARSLVSGAAGCRGVSPLSLWDVDTGQRVAFLESNFKFGAGVLDVQFESPNEILSAGYDTFLRLWDIRTGQCEREWEEPFDSTIYCFQTDSSNVMVTGTARHGMTRLWDKRRSKPLQMYYTGERSSPVYSLIFDACHLLVALDYSVNLLDFTARIRNRSW